MPLKNYGLLKARPIDTKNSKDHGHLEIHLKADGDVDYRIALNVRSAATPSELYYLIHKDFVHPIVDDMGLENLKEGITSKSENPAIGIDYIRSNIFNVSKMKLAGTISQGDNELFDIVQLYVERAMKCDAMIYAFGQYWGPENKKDDYFGFLPGRGIHDIHMNQGNAGNWAKDNGTYQDGALLIHFPLLKQWVSIFTAFQSQSFYTDDNGDVIDVAQDDVHAVVIVGALLNPSSGNQRVYLLNRVPRTIDINGWKLAGMKGNQLKLSGSMQPGEYLEVDVKKGALSLPSGGGVITLFDKSGAKIHGASYATPAYAMKDHIKVF
ncbi:MAG: DUF2278 family protein [Polyangiaceae bacterium]|nr:DUF2278 family protein [Polyangiaceae bacterium]